MTKPKDDLQPLLTHARMAAFYAVSTATVKRMIRDGCDPESPDEVLRWSVNRRCQTAAFADRIAALTPPRWTRERDLQLQATLPALPAKARSGSRHRDAGRAPKRART